MKPPVNVAILDDDVLFAEALESLLERSPEVKVTMRVHDRAALLAGLEDRPDLLLLDLKLRDDSGLELIGVLQSSFPELKVIALSAFYKPSYLGMAFRNGFSAFLPKNTSSGELVKAIVSVHETGIYFKAEDMEKLRVFLEKPSAEAPGFTGATLLSEREKEVLNLICRQCSNSEIAEKLFISVRTVEGHRNRIFEKTGLINTAGLVIYAISSGIIDLDELILRQSLDI